MYKKDSNLQVMGLKNPNSTSLDMIALNPLIDRHRLI